MTMQKYRLTVEELRGFLQAAGLDDLKINQITKNFEENGVHSDDTEQSTEQT